MLTYSTLTVEQRGSVDWITLNRPEKLNALNDTMVSELWTFFSNIQNDHARRVVVLRGAGRGFCSGLDLKAVTSSEVANVPLTPDTPAPSLPSLILLMRSCPQPIVALIHGAACGGGFSLALASDIRIAGRSTRMNVAFVKLGLSGCELGTSHFLPRMLGSSVAAELMMTGRFIHADRALSLGLVSQVVDDDALDEAGQELVEEMLALSAVGLRQTKVTLERAAKIEDLATVIALEERTQALCIQDPAFQEAVAAFSLR